MRAGKDPSAQWGPVVDVLSSGAGNRMGLGVQLQEALLAKRYEAVVLYDHFFEDRYFPFAELDRAYVKVGDQKQSDGNTLAIYEPRR